MIAARLTCCSRADHEALKADGLAAFLARTGEVGLQAGLDGEPVLVLRSCPRCTSTLAMHLDGCGTSPAVVP